MKRVGEMAESFPPAYTTCDPGCAFRLPRRLWLRRTRTSCARLSSPGMIYALSVYFTRLLSPETPEMLSRLAAVLGGKA